ncbi:hypothetical protein DESC_720312 [Desulfosarcina cetonica]|nr:hypothetical protein DESC_720312 [Desulfosarcina cetonica]
MHVFRNLPPDELANHRQGAFLDLFRPSLKYNPSLIQHGNPLGNVKYVGNFMADHHAGKAIGFLVLENHGVGRILTDGVESGGRLVKKHNFRIGHQGARHGHTLFHAAGKLGRIKVFDAGQVQLGQFFTHARLDVMNGELVFLLQRQGDIFVNGHGIEKRIPLKHVTEFHLHGPALGGIHGLDRPAGEQNLAFIRFQQADDMFEQDAFADTTFANDGGHLSTVDRQVDPLEDGIVAEALEYIFEFDQRFGHGPLIAETRSAHSRKPESTRRRSPPPRSWKD